MKDTPQYYGTLSRFFHWLMAAMFAFMLCTAAMWNINEKYYSLMGYHKSVGFPAGFGGLAAGLGAGQLAQPPARQLGGEAGACRAVCADGGGAGGGDDSAIRLCTRRFGSVRHHGDA